MTRNSDQSFQRPYLTFRGPTATKYRMAYIVTSRIEIVYPVLPCIQELLKAHSHFLKLCIQYSHTCTDI